MNSGFHDKFLLAGSLAGDEEQFGKIYDKYSQAIYRYIFFRISDHELAQDLMADTFLRAWQYVSAEEREIDNLKALLYRIAGNLVVDFYRRRGREVSVREIGNGSYWQPGYKLPPARKNRIGRPNQ